MEGHMTNSTSSLVLATGILLFPLDKMLFHHKLPQAFNHVTPRACHKYVLLAPVVQRLDNAIHRINHYPADKC